MELGKTWYFRPNITQEKARTLRAEDSKLSLIFRIKRRCRVSGSCVFSEGESAKRESPSCRALCYTSGVTARVRKRRKRRRYKKGLGMGWELRAGRRVYYRKVREGGKVRSVYFGSGVEAEAAALEDERRRATRAPGKKVSVDTPCVDGYPMRECAAACDSGDKEKSELSAPKKRWQRKSVRRKKRRPKV
jgi:hypothetical protein